MIWRRWASRRPTGIDRVCLAYLEHFGERAQAVVQHRHFRGILSEAASAALFHLLRSPRPHFRRQLITLLMRHAGRMNLAGNGRLYLNIGHTGLDGDGFADWVRAAGVKPVYLVHDLIPITHPEFCRAGEAERHRKRMRTVLATAAGVIGNSQATLDSLEEFARAVNMPYPPAVAAWLGSTPMSAPSGAAAPRRPHFVALGTVEGRKNHLLLLNIWSRLVSRFGADAPRLLIIGQRGWEAEQVCDILDRSEALRGHVVELNRCNDEDLAGHLASARALLFPSLVEGFGLPLIEALSLGVPAIASDLPVFREIGQGVPDFLSPIDGLGWESLILDYAAPDSPSRAAQLDRIRTFRAPGWEAHFRTVEDWLPRLMSPSPAVPASIPQVL